MSRIGKKIIQIPEGVTVNNKNGLLKIKGPKGELSLKTRPEVNIDLKENTISVTTHGNSRIHHSLHGLTRTLIYNMIIGVTVGYNKQLEIKGVGYKAESEDENLKLNLGFSHPVIFNIPEGITIEVKKNIIDITGIDKQLVGEVAAKIRRLKPPEPYKGKGIKYVDEIIRRKAGKAAKAAEGASAK